MSEAYLLSCVSKKSSLCMSMTFWAPGASARDTSIEDLCDSRGERDACKLVAAASPGHGQYLLGSGRSQGHPSKGVSGCGRGERDACEGIAACAARCCRRALRRRRGRGLPSSSRPEDLPLLQLCIVGACKAIARLLYRHQVTHSKALPSSYRGMLVMTPNLSSGLSVGRSLTTGKPSPSSLSAAAWVPAGVGVA